MLCHWICRNHLALHHLVSGKCQIHHRTITSQRLPVTMLLEMMIFPIIHKSYHHNRDRISPQISDTFSNICTNLSLFSLLFLAVYNTLRQKVGNTPRAKSLPNFILLTSLFRSSHFFELIGSD